MPRAAAAAWRRRRCFLLPCQAGSFRSPRLHQALAVRLALRFESRPKDILVSCWAANGTCWPIVMLSAAILYKFRRGQEPFMVTHPEQSVRNPTPDFSATEAAVCTSDGDATRPILGHPRNLLKLAWPALVWRHERSRPPCRQRPALHGEDHHAALPPRQMNLDLAV